MLASGSGTILHALLAADLPIVVVLVDRECGAIEVARAAGVPVEVVERTSFGRDFDRVAYTHAVVDALARSDVDLVAMAGFGTILEKPMHDAFPDRIVNTHPALLPAFKGWHAVEDALAAGVKVTGCTVHIARLEVDDGPILAQEAVPVYDDDTVETLQERIKEVERRLYPEVLRRLAGEDALMRALLSVWDKTGLVDFARGLHELGWELVSSGGTARAMEEAGVPVVHLAEFTGFPEMLDHRVVTLHPKVHGGILADRSKASHLADLEQYDIAPFDMVVSNLYPFRESPDIETIDIGGPAMTRAAAKNHAWVAIVTDPAQYDDVLAELREQGALSDATRRALALEAFARTAAYDAAIVAWLQRDDALPEHLVLALDRTGEQLRYGENPHQQAARYRTAGTTSWWDGVVQHSGLALVVPQSLRRRRRVADRARSGRASPRARSSSTPTRAASRLPTTSPPRTSARSSATNGPRSAGSWR